MYYSIKGHLGVRIGLCRSVGVHMCVYVRIVVASA